MEIPTIFMNCKTVLKWLCFPKKYRLGAVCNKIPRYLFAEMKTLILKFCEAARDTE